MGNMISMDNRTRRIKSGKGPQVSRLPAIQATGVWMAMALSAWGLITVALLAVI